MPNDTPDHIAIFFFMTKSKIMSMYNENAIIENAIILPLTIEQEDFNIT